MKKFKKVALVLVMLVFSSFVLTACDFSSVIRNFFQSITPGIVVDDSDADNNSNQNPNTQQDGPQENPNNIANQNYVLNSNLTKVKSITITSEKVLTWDVVAGASEYHVAYYSNNTPETVVQVENNAFDFNFLEPMYEIFAFRVGVENGSNQVEYSNVVYYNPHNVAPFTEQIYYFNGQIHDRYITSEQEYFHIAHYAFIHKIPSFNVRLSTTYYNTIIQNSGVGGTESNKFVAGVEKLIEKAFRDSFVETISIAFGAEHINSDLKTFVTTIDFLGAEVPTLSLQKTMVQDSFEKPYYERVNYEPRQENYDNFITDNRIKIAPVSTSEELYWAIESGATPIFSSTQSSGYIMYQHAKEVLREIISNEMTDYEKVLSIFDYIAYNTVYDYQMVEKDNFGTYIYLNGQPFNAYKSFYLEGVFYDGLAVCDGFSKAFSLLVNMEGIPAVRIVGTAGGGGHAWNKVLLNGKWYVVDITWTEIEMEHYNTGNNTEYLTHKYFLVSDADITTHTPDASQDYKNHEANTRFDFYGQIAFTFNGVNYDRIIDKKSDVVALINYLWENFQNSEIASMEVVLTQQMINNWATYVREVKDNYNLLNFPNRFDNDVLKVADSTMQGGNYYFIYTQYRNNTNGNVSIVQIHNTFLNLQNQN